MPYNVAHNRVNRTEKNLLHLEILGSMTCNDTDPVERDSTMAARISFLILVLILTTGGNLAFFLQMRQGSGRWSASKWLLRQLAIIGALNGLVHVGVYTLFNLTENGAFGEAFCQLYGLFGSVLISSWTWLLAISALERFLCLVLPSEHPCLFSEVNTRIMTWGIFLLMLVLYLGPIYGWGEYSYLRGKVDIKLTVGNYTPMKEENWTELSLFAFQFYQTYQTLSAMGNVSLERTINNLPGLDTVYFRRPLSSVSGIVYPVRMRDRRTFECLLQHYTEDSLGIGVAKEMKDVNVPASLGVSDFHIKVDLNVTQVSEFEQVALVYQECSKCGLDYTSVNDNIYSFVALSWFWALVVPFSFIFYFHIRSLFQTFHRYDVFSSNEATREDRYMTKVLACCSMATFFCDAPYYTVNLAAGLGTPVSHEVHFAANIVLYSSWMLPWILFMMTSTRWECIGCSAHQSICCRLSFLRGGCSQSSVRRKRQRSTGNCTEMEVKRGLLSQAAGSVSNSPALSVNSVVVRNKDLETIL